MNEIILKDKTSVLLFGKSTLKNNFCFSIKLNKINVKIGVGIIDPRMRNKSNMHIKKNMFGFWSDGECIRGG